MSDQSSGYMINVDDVIDLTSDMDITDYKKLSQIGMGSFGLVYKVMHKTTKNIYALKEIKFNNMNFRDICKDTEREIYALKEIEHENLVKYHGACIVKRHFNILTEFMDKSSLREHIDKNGALQECDVVNYVTNILNGINYLHSKNVIHRDIKCGNVLLNTSGQVKLADFGLSKQMRDIDELCQQTNCGTFKYQAPEMLENKPYNSAVDVWATGVTVIEMLTGYPIYPDLLIKQFIEKVINIDDSIDFPNLEAISTNLSYFLDIIFIKNPAMRPKPDDLLRTKFLLEIN